MNYKQLTTNERYQIYTLKKEGFSQKAIARSLGRSASTISRELKRNTGLRGYRPRQAQLLTENRRKAASKSCKVTPLIYAYIKKLLRQELSPEQVVNYLHDEGVVSLHHETIYQLVYEDKACGGDLYKHLRIVSKPYRKRYGSYDSRGKIKHRVSIDSRPLVVDKRSRVGDWEGDTIIGKGRQSALLTLVERKTLFTVIVKIQGKKSVALADAMIKAMRPYQHVLKTVTFDNGHEFSCHQRIAKSLNAKIYFAHPYSSWERGINENTNGLIRQYFPKGMDLNQVTQSDINFVMSRLNNRPRKTRDYKTPNEMFIGRRVNLLSA